jgi:plastocyanin
MFGTADAGGNFLIYLPYVKDASIGVTLTDGKFTPPTFAVSPGTIVQWENNDTVYVNSNG